MSAEEFKAYCDRIHVNVSDDNSKFTVEITIDGKLVYHYNRKL